MTTQRLTDLRRGYAAFVVTVEDQFPDDPIATRLRELGFVEGERIRVKALGPFSREPLLVQVGSTRFALRRAEAQRVHIQMQSTVQSTAPLKGPSTEPATDQKAA